MKRIAVLGSGRVGGLIAIDLAADPEIAVRVADADERSLAAVSARANVETRVVDLSDDDHVRRVVADCDAVVGAVPGSLGLGVIRATIMVGRPLVDISFTPQDPYELDDAARDAGVPVVVDCGVAPGLSNLFVGRAATDLDRVDSVKILVGGLPERRVWPWEYRSVFSPTDVIEEYTRPARIRRGGREHVRPALSELELLELPGVGTVEAFLTDGLRSLLRTVDAPELIEKTLRWPGHAERIRLLRESGFFGGRAIDVDGVRIVPRSLTEHLLFAAWRPEPEDRELTALRVEVRGARSGSDRRIVWDLLDRTDESTGTTSMARTTGFPCALVARMLLDGRWARPGVHPPESLGTDERVTGDILDGLEARGVRVRRREVVGDCVADVPAQNNDS